jgi:hypothetical protein
MMSGQSRGAILSCRKKERRRNEGRTALADNAGLHDRLVQATPRGCSRRRPSDVARWTLTTSEDWRLADIRSEQEARRTAHRLGATWAW